MRSSWNLRRKMQSIYYRVRGFYPVDIAGRRFRVHPDDRRFWRKLAHGKWEPHTFKILAKFLRPRTVYLDIGAWIGPTILFAAAHDAEVYCFEPDGVAYRQLLSNLQLNSMDNVHPFHAAVFTYDGVVNIGNAEEFGNSESRISPNKQFALSARVPCVKIETAMQLWQLDTVDMIKIDIEGAEFELLPAMATCLKKQKPVVYLSIHAPFFDASVRPQLMQNIISLAQQYRYSLDRDLQPLKPQELLSSRYTDKFAELVLTDHM